MFRCAFLLSMLIALFAGLPAHSQTAKASDNVDYHGFAGYHIHAHAHNDYEHKRPLLDALQNRFYSVEADFWLVDGELMVSHDKGKYKGSLKDLYLDPLQKIVDEKGSVHGDREPFYLWLDIKDDSEETMPVLHSLLQTYSMLSVHSSEGKSKAGPVTAILTGTHKLKTLYAERYATGWACRDSNHYSPDDPRADGKWLWYAVNWNNHFSWRGEGPIPDDEQQKLAKMAKDMHGKGRSIRFYSTPDVPAYWQLALDSGIDHINTDKLPELNQFLSTVK